MNFSIRPLHIVLLLLVVLAILVHNLYFTGTISGNGFAETDIAGIEEGIREDIEKNGKARVEHIAMIIKEPKEMAGFVKMRTSSGELIQQECIATMGRSRHIIWKCSSK
jgi:hypothetical protein